MGIKTAREARDILGDTGGGTSPARGEEIYDFVRNHGFESCLELGVAHGVGSVYIAAALEANGSGLLTGVDNLTARDERDPSPQSLIDKAGLSHRVDLAYEETSYIWFLHDMLRKQLRDGAIEPVYDFVFIDGAHTWEADALAFELADRLLKPGGWLLLDDLDWKLDDRYPDVPQREKDIAQVRAVWELLALTNPAYDYFETEGQWGWMRKSVEDNPATRTLVKRDLVGSVRELGRLARRKLRR